MKSSQTKTQVSTKARVHSQQEKTVFIRNLQKGWAILFPTDKRTQLKLEARLGD